MLDEPQKHHANLRKLDTKGQTLFNSIYPKLLARENYRKHWLPVAAVGEGDRLQSGMKEPFGDDGSIDFFNFDGHYITRYICQNANCPFKMGKFYDV